MKFSFFGKQMIAGVVLSFQGTERTISCVTANLTGDEIIIQNVKETNNIDSLEISRATRVNLAIVGAEVLIKKLPISTRSDAFYSVNSAFPFLKISEFYVQTFFTSSAVFVSVIRLDVLSGVFAQLAKKNIYPVSLCLGPFAFPQLNYLLEDLSISYHVPPYQLFYKKGEIQDIQNSTTEITHVKLSLQVENLPNNLIYNFALILNLVTPIIQFETINTQTVIESRQIYLHRFFQYCFGLVAGGLVLLMLSIGFFFFMKAFSRNNQLIEQIEPAVVIQKKLDSLKLHYQAKAYLLDSMSSSSPLRIAFYADELAKVLPIDIILTELLVYPPEKTRNNKRISYEKGIIQVKGICQDHLTLETWITSFKSFPWVKLIESKKYEYNDDKRIGIFEIRIRTIN